MVSTSWMKLMNISVEIFLGGHEAQRQKHTYTHTHTHTHTHIDFAHPQLGLGVFSCYRVWNILVKSFVTTECGT